ncbi:MAG: ABC transporter substrate-binding protein [Cellulosilyticaceae bacterium]
MKLRKMMLGMMCVAIAVGSIGCGAKTEAPKETAGADKKTEATTSAGGVDIKYWVQMNGNVIPVAQNYGEVEYYKQLAEKTGVKINFLHPPVGQEKDQFKLLIASRKDLPDVIQAIWLNEYPGGPEKAIKDGIIIPLNDYIDQMPNYKKAIEADPELLKQCKTDDGTIYAFQGLNQNNLKTFCGMMLRKDWLDELGLEAPETIDEWETVLRAFKDQKGATVPLSIRDDELMNYMSEVNLFNAAYEVGCNFYLDDSGKVQYGPIQPGYKEYLKTLNKWYNEGLLDPDFASIDDKIIDANLLNGKSGAAFGYIGGSMSKWYKAATDEKFELVAVPNPVLKKGDEGKFLSTFSNRISGPGAAITTSAKNVKEIIKMFDYLYTEEGKMLKNFGVEGMTYNMVDGKPVYTDLIMNNPEGLGIGNAMGKYIQANYGGPGFTEIPEYQSQYYQLDSQKEGSKAINKFVDSAAPYVIPPITATPDESKDLATIMTDVDTYRQEQFVAFVTGAQPIEKFDEYVAVIKQLNIDRAIEIKQAGVERYNNR